MVRSAVRPVQILLALGVAAFFVSTLPGVRPDRFDPVLDGWLQGGTYVLAAVLAALRPLTVAADRRLWTFVAVAVALRAIGFVVFLAVVRELDPLPYPSAADVAWLGMCVVLAVGLVDHARAHHRRGTAALALDGLVGGLATAALALVLLDGTLAGLTAAGTPTDALVTNLAYPIADVLLLLVIIGMLAARAWRAPAALWLLAGGIAAFAILDSVFLYQATAGTFRPGTPLSALSVAASALMAAAAWAPGGPAPARRAAMLPGVVLPGLFFLVCVVVLVVASTQDVPVAAVLLATGGLLAALTRTTLSFREIRTVAESRREARTDDLTGIANRRAFNERLERALRGRSPTRPLALLVIDLDDFKDVNDTLGHHHGDELLQHVAPRLRLALRGDDLLARIGGDEFAIVLDGADAEQAGRVAERLGAAMRRPFPIAGTELPADASVGVALFPRDGESAATLLKHADLAMYDAKASSASFRFFSADEHRTNLERLQTVDRLRRAIGAGELELHFQPQVLLATGAVFGAEALVRWRHPDEGLLPPGRFLPQAESGGLMRALSLTVLDQALGRLVDWRGRGVDVTLSVNLSVTNLLDTEFPAHLARLLDGAGVSGERLVVELTEDVFMADPGQARKVMGALLDAGVGIAVDDYGTGFSSLGYLRDLEGISVLKLDRSFVTGLDREPRSAAIVGSTVTLARALGLALVAEGVETEAVRDRLAELGCERAQGFLFSRPVPAGELVLDHIAAAVAAPKRTPVR